MVNDEMKIKPEWLKLDADAWGMISKSWFDMKYRESFCGIE